MAHKQKFVRPGEFWTLYWTMIVGSFFWGSFWSILVWRWFRFNHQALIFLLLLTITSSLCLGLTLYARLRGMAARAERRHDGVDLELT